jgi:hypothetical protein
MLISQSRTVTGSLVTAALRHCLTLLSILVCQTLRLSPHSGSHHHRLEVVVELNESTIEMTHCATPHTSSPLSVVVVVVRGRPSVSRPSVRHPSVPCRPSVRPLYVVRRPYVLRPSPRRRVTTSLRRCVATSCVAPSLPPRRHSLSQCVFRALLHSFSRQ